MDRRQFAAGLTADELVGHDREIAKFVRISGSEDEARAFDYIQAYLTGLGYDVRRYAAEALIGFPVESSLQVLTPEGMAIDCNGYSLTTSTGLDGVVGELVYVGAGLAEDYRGVDARGKVVLTDGLATPAKAVAADEAGAIAHIQINDERIHNFCISQVWGTPTPATAGLLPKTPSVAIISSDGDRLKALMQKGPVTVKVVNLPYRDWRPIPILTADLPGTEEDTFVLFSGHVDSWGFGAMDNGSSNATQLSVGRILAEQRGQLRRGVRLAFWSGHSHGRYAGSTWYVDHHWQELHDRCVCHVNIDSVGAIGAEVVSEVQTMAETLALGAQMIHEVTGQELEYRRMSRSSDQSFWGVGIPSLYAAFSEQLGGDSAIARAQAAMFGGGGGRAGGLGWWWHTSEDTVDKIDPANLLRDARVYAATLWELCTRPVLPFDYAAAAREIRGHLQKYQEAAAGRLDLSSLITLTSELEGVVVRFNETASKAGDPKVVNRFLMGIGHALIPVNYTETGPFDQDLALNVPPIPGLAPVTRLATLDPSSDEFRFLGVKLLREQNRFGAGLKNALLIAETALAQLRR